MRHHLSTEIDIAAPTPVVWAILVDLPRYADWNPFITSAEGRVEVGQRLTNRFQPPGGRAVTLRPTVTDVEPGRRFEWLGRLGLPGLFDGRHRFELSPIPGAGTRLVHTEHFSGLLVRPFRREIDTGTRAGFVAMNEAVRHRAEAAAPAVRDRAEAEAVGSVGRTTQMRPIGPV